jgi:hypothetical protein
MEAELDTKRPAIFEAVFRTCVDEAERDTKRCAIFKAVIATFFEFVFRTFGVATLDLQR